MLSSILKKYIEGNDVKMTEELQGIVNTLEEADEELEFLEALRAAGVDNWEGYEYAVDLLNGDL
ncbi:hypothetical protein [Lundtoftevirus Lu221]|uniref:Uncharacterized protein n=1 Tax=phage PKM.Lu.22.1 TaxID=3049197 RepID=A0AAF0KYD3_9CAUD|nr:hypothetical protein [phage PKM.Lu.22.1]